MNMSTATSRTATRRRTGFTVVELLVVVAIIILLVALTMPVADRAIFNSTSAACSACRPSATAS